MSDRSTAGGDSNLQVRADHGRITVSWTGRINAMDPSPDLRPKLDRVLADAESKHVPVTMDLTGLDFINSAGITCLVRFLSQSRRAGIRVTLLYSGEERWQQVSLAPLAVLSTVDGLIEVVSVDESPEGTA